MEKLEKFKDILGRAMPRLSEKASESRLTDPAECKARLEAALEAEIKCKVCRDIGWVLVKGELKRCRCMKEDDEQRKNERFLKMCQLPSGSQHMTLENFRRNPGMKEAYDAALQLADESSDIKWVTLMGGVDRGKTHLGIAICRRWLQRGKAARYAFVPTLLDELRQGFEREGEESYAMKFNFYCNVPMLVLDDLGTEKRSDWVTEKLDTIVDYRYINALPLVVTTNLPMDELSPRIASRLQRAEFGRIVVLEVPEYRLRRRKGEESYNRGYKQ